MELGLIAPVLLALALAGTDLVNTLRAQMRLEAAAMQLGQVVSQCSRITTPGDTDQFWSFAQRIVGSLGSVSGTGATGAVIVSAVAQSGGATRVVWQHRSGNTTTASRIGTAGAVATLPGALVVPTGQTLMVTEIYLPRDSWSLASAIMGGANRRVLNAMTLFLTRAVDAPALQQPPAARTQPDCTA
ncbi:hypothetical protein [Falsiroseomonas oryzae]|uniref:hypothetical protein n=1 Tax=Falsiroseomonas oryzae TaxID=2766473 RepID=UPI0022EA9863|nr:hypothetical protein [Roseomonas sp. MO-31]